MEQLQKGDIIRSPRGYFAHVNWDDGEWVGCSFIEKSFPSLACMTYKKDEIFVVRRGPKQFWKEMFKLQSDEMLREEIKQERAMRTILPSEKEKVARKRDNVTSLLKDLSVSDQEALIQMIREKKG